MSGSSVNRSPPTTASQNRRTDAVREARHSPAILVAVTQKVPRPASDWLPPVVADLVCVLVFAIAGKSSHEASDPGSVVLAIMWPFALSVVIAHAGLLMGGRQSRRVWPEGVLVLSATYVLGMLLRVVSGRGIAVGFLVVAVLFLALAMLGWRSILAFAASRLTPTGRGHRDR